jgi:hypothetical protein
MLTSVKRKRRLECPTAIVVHAAKARLEGKLFPESYGQGADPQLLYWLLKLIRRVRRTSLEI